MAESDTQPARPPGSPERSLSSRLLLAMGAAMVLILAAFLVWDYLSGWRIHLAQRRTALHDEAETLLQAVLRLKDRPEAVQSYVDTVCAQMREASSPGHHIVVELAGAVLQAHAHQQPTERLHQTMRAGAEGPHGLADTNRGRIVVGDAARDGITVLVSEYVVDIQRLMRAQILRRALSIACLGLALAAVVNMLVRHLVHKPLEAIVTAVRATRAGRVGVLVPAVKTREFSFLAEEFNAMSSALAQTDAERRRQMVKARRIQQNLIPPVRADEQFRAIYRAAEWVAGDYFDLFRTDAGAQVLCVADVSGHGVPAALLAAMLKTLFTAACAETAELPRLLATINERLAAVTLDEDFASMIVVSLDRRLQQVRYASAGHEPAYLVGREGPARVLHATGPPLGIQADGRWEEQTLGVCAGDRLVMLTDGLPELPTCTGGFVGRKTVAGLFEDTRSGSLDEVCGRITQLIDLHTDGQGLPDDITVLVVDL